MYIICKEALVDCPSCAPALDALALYYFHLACLLRDAAAAAAASSSAAAGGAAAPAGDEALSGGGGGVLARARDAVGNALQVLDKAAVADPMRRPYLAQRRAEAEALLAQLEKLRA